MIDLNALPLPTAVGTHSAPDINVDATVGRVIPPEPPTGDLSGMPGTAYFFAGGVYEYVGVPFDLVAQCRDDLRIEVPAKLYTLRKPVVANPTPWAPTLYAMPAATGREFLRWVVNQAFVRRAANVAWQVRGRLVDVPAADLGDRDVAPDVVVPVTFLLPYGTAGVVELDAARRMWVSPPHPAGHPYGDAVRALLKV